jgi:hypothetical protein
MKVDAVFRSRRSNVMATRGMVATSQPLAAQAGLTILQAGGNAADAAIATAAMLNVVEPISTGIGGDCFALYWDAKSKQVTALNGSGRQGQPPLPNCNRPAIAKCRLTPVTRSASPARSPVGAISWRGMGV